MTLPPSDQLVLRVNEVYHDVEGPAYAHLHPEIFAAEAARWRDLADRFIRPLPRPITLADIGAGTGFVGAQVGPFLIAADTLVCCDLSARMLDLCRQTLDALNLACRRTYVKLDGRTLPFDPASLDVLTLNSVLHHLPDPGRFLRDAARALRPGGRLIVNHEPNRAFYAHWFLAPTACIARALLAPRAAVGDLLRRAGLMEPARRLARRLRPADAAHARTLDEVNRQLLAEAAILRPLTQDELTALVDIQSPTAGGAHPARGLDIAALVHRHMPDCTLELLETHDHLGDRTTTGPLATRAAATLRRRFPLAGATLCAVVRRAQ